MTDPVMSYDNVVRSDKTPSSTAPQEAPTMTDTDHLPTLCTTQALIGDGPIALRAFEVPESGHVHVDGIAPGLNVVCDDLRILRRLVTALDSIANDLEGGDVRVNSIGNRNTSVTVGEPLILGVVE